jgi:hypothetical protein
MRYNFDHQRPMLTAVFPSHTSIEFRRYPSAENEHSRDHDLVEFSFTGEDGDHHCITMTRFEFQMLMALVENTDDTVQGHLNEAL